MANRTFAREGVLRYNSGVLQTKNASRDVQPSAGTMPTKEAQHD